MTYSKKIRFLVSWFTKILLFIELLSSAAKKIVLAYIAQGEIIGMLSIFFVGLRSFTSYNRIHLQPETVAQRNAEIAVLDVFQRDKLLYRGFVGDFIVILAIRQTEIIASVKYNILVLI